MSKINSVKILEGKKCDCCGWPVIHVCCNDNFLDGACPEDPTWDWWYYCSNKGCKNHGGEGVFQSNPEWVINDD